MDNEKNTDSYFKKGVRNTGSHKNITLIRVLYYFRS
jgi:hypothetical protein